MHAWFVVKLHRIGRSRGSAESTLHYSGIGDIAYRVYGPVKRAAESAFSICKAEHEISTAAITLQRKQMKIRAQAKWISHKDEGKIERDYN